MNEIGDEVDLHIHTCLSDGDMAPELVVGEAQRIGLAGIAITDHDTVDGVEIAIEAAGSGGLEVVPGVELSTSDGKSDIHILGYLIDIRNAKLLDYLAFFREARLKRGVEMVDRLKKLGVDIEVDSVLEIAGGGAVGRPHVAEALVRNGYVESFQEAFRRYIGFNSPAYVPKYHLRPSSAFEIITDAGGVGALAHPGTTRRDDLVTEFTAAGMRAIEVYHPKHSETVAKHYKMMADKMGLVATGGSDSHGTRDGALRLGSCTVPHSAIEKLRRARSY